MVIYLPFAEDVGIFRTHVERLVEGGSTVPEALQSWVLLGFAVLIVGLAWRTKSDLGDMLRSWAIAMLVFVAFLSEIGFAWYVIAPMALVALVQDWRVVMAAIALSLAALAFQLRDSAFTASFPLPELFDIDRFWVFLLMSLAAGGIGAVGMWTRRRAKAKPST